jgi:phosphatidate cytidylyltransferase
MSEASAKASDLPTRFAAAVAMIAVAVAAIYLGGWPFRILVLAGAAAMLVEWADMHRVKRLWAWVGAALLAVQLLVVSELLYPAGQIDVVEDEAGELVMTLAPESFEPVWQGLAAAAGLALLLWLLSRRGRMGWGFFYIAAPAFALLILSWADYGVVLWAMVVTWSTDIFAYFTGRGIGGPKLAPRISPNKTWAGLIGGMAGAGLLGAMTAMWLDLATPFVFAGAVMGLLAQLGDLYESAVKRRAGVKDSGSLLPGHGGVLDRVDGLLPVALATLALLITSLGPA